MFNSHFKRSYNVSCNFVVVVINICLDFFRKTKTNQHLTTNWRAIKVTINLSLASADIWHEPVRVGEISKAWFNF